MRRLFLLAALLCLPAPVAAQTTQPALPNSVDIMVLPATGDEATTAPIATRNQTLGATATNCNLAASTGTVPSPLVNPTIAEFDDPFNAGKVCRAPMPTGLPTGTGYRAVAQFVATCVDAAGVSTTCRSPRSAVGIPPFNISPILVAPAAPTRLVIRP